MKLDRLKFIPLAVAAGLMVYAVCSKGEKTRIDIGKPEKKRPPVVYEETAEKKAPVLSDPDGDVASGKPLVIHVVVALCDNKNQGIVKVSEDLGNGQNPDTNLYWGAMYGVKTFLKKNKGWYTAGIAPQKKGSRILDKILLQKTILRKGKPVNVYLVAEAWDGRYIKEAITRFLEFTTGGGIEVLRFESLKELIYAGGSSHMVCFVGHNGLMDFNIETDGTAMEGTVPQTAAVLACRSRKYFESIIPAMKGRTLLLTQGLMAPEAYTLDAAVEAWVKGKEPAAVRDAAAEAYAEYQKCSLQAAQDLFHVAVQE